MKTKEVIFNIFLCLILVYSVVAMVGRSHKRGLRKGFDVGFEAGSSMTLDTVNKIIKDQLKDTTGNRATRLSIQGNKDTATYILSSKTIK